jgi:hypothetical protein
MKKALRIICLVLITAVVAGQVQAQSLEERLRQYGISYGKGYTSPFGDAFGASLNSGWYQTADVSDGLDIFIGVKAMLLPIPDEARSFSFASPVDGVVQSLPTLFGDKTEVAISGVPGTVSPNKYAPGFDLKWAPMGVPHISVGNIFGTRVMLRFLPKLKFGDLGDYSFFGIGVQHSISRWVPSIPLDVAGLVAYQSMSLGDIVTANAFTIGVQASKKFSILTLYAGAAYESSTLSFSYTASYQNPAPPNQTLTTPVTFDLNGKNSVRFTGGLCLSLAIIKLSADYSFAAQPVATVGIGIGI